MMGMGQDNEMLRPMVRYTTGQNGTFPLTTTQHGNKTVRSPEGSRHLRHTTKEHVLREVWNV